jgi:hypothetical protein
VHGLELVRRRGVGGHAWCRCPRTVRGVPRDLVVLEDAIITDVTL